MSGKLKIKKGDMVAVISGKDKGRVGKVLRVLPEASRVVVEGVRVVTRHQKGSGDQPGQILHKEAPMHISNVALWNEAEGRRVKVAYAESDDGSKVRDDRSTGAQLD